MTRMQKVLNFSGLFLVPILAFLLGPKWTQIFADQKQLQYEIVADNKISNVTSGEKGWKDLRYEYKGRTLELGRIVTINIANTGRQPIQKSDFEGPITTRTEGSGAVIDARIAATRPPNIFANAVATERGAEITPTLLNPGDNIWVELLIDSEAKIVEVSARIAGVTRVEPIPEDKGRMLYIASIETYGARGSSYSTVFPLHWAILATITPIVFFASVSSLRVATSASKPALKGIMWVAAIATQTIAILSCILATKVLEPRATPVWFDMSLAIVWICASMFAALYAVPYVRERQAGDA